MHFPRESVCLVDITISTSNSSNNQQLGRGGQQIRKSPSWWLILSLVGDSGAGKLQLLGMKRVGKVASSNMRVQMQFESPKQAGDVQLVVRMVCDALLGVDQTKSMDVVIF
jgi:hypothetical protein